MRFVSKHQTRRGSGGNAIGGLMRLVSTGFVIGCASLAGTATAVAGDGKTEDSKLKIGGQNSFIQFYGQIDKGLLVYDDGRTSKGYFPVDNDARSTRFGFNIFSRLDQVWSVNGNVEAEWTPYSTADVNQITENKVDWGTSLLRKAEVYVDNTGLGRLWLGQGSMASDGTSENDLSGTYTAGYASVADIAGGQLYRLSDGSLSGIRVGDTFRDFDGLSRKFRVRYDSPDFNGLVLGVSAGRHLVPETTGGTVWDVAAKYTRNLGDTKIASAIAYSDPGGAGRGLVNGSVSALHVPTGLSLTLAGAINIKPGRNARYIYGKLGHQADYFEFGTTALSVDAYNGENLNSAGSNSTSFGFQAVQNVDAWQTEFYLGIRSYDYRDGAGNYQPGIATIAGARIRF
jgi:hypothetical protein